MIIIRKAVKQESTEEKLLLRTALGGECNEPGSRYDEYAMDPLDR